MKAKASVARDRVLEVARRRLRVDSETTTAALAELARASKTTVRDALRELVRRGEAKEVGGHPAHRRWVRA